MLHILILLDLVFSIADEFYTEQLLFDLKKREWSL